MLGQRKAVLRMPRPLLTITVRRMPRPYVRCPIVIHRNLREGEIAVYRVQIVAATLAAGEMHHHQTVEDGRAIDAGRGGLQQVIHGGGRDGPVVDRQRSHHLLRGRVQARVGIAHQRVHHVVGHRRG